MAAFKDKKEVCVDSTIQKSIVANYSGAFASLLFPMVSLPIYLHSFGVEGWGVISLCLTVVAFVGVIEGGASQILVREISIRSQQFGHRSSQTRECIGQCYGAYCMVAAAAFFIAQITALTVSFIALEAPDRGDFERLLPITLALVLTQIAGGLPRGMMYAFQLHKSLNRSIIAGQAARHIGGAAISLVTSDVLLVLGWYVVINALEACGRLAIIAKLLTAKLLFEARLSIDAGYAKATAKMAFASLLGGSATQFDKVVVSHFSGLSAMGAYSVAANLAAAALALSYPVIQAVLPALVRRKDDPQAVAQLVQKWVYAVAALVLFGAATYWILGYHMLALWLNSEKLAQTVFPILALLLCGVSLNFFYQISYGLWIAAGAFVMPLTISAVAFVQAITFLPLVVAYFGANAAPVSWIIPNLVGCVLGYLWFKRWVRSAVSASRRRSA